MNHDWQEFITSKGAILEDGSINGFEPFEGPYYSDKETYLCDLSMLGVIKAVGEDAQTFLHGQFTNDLNQVDNTSSQISGYCNAKGRLLSIFRVLKHNESYLMLLRKDVLERTLAKLNMFKLMAKVDLTDATDEYVVFGLVGNNTEPVLNKNNIKFPDTDGNCSYTNEYIVTRIDERRALIIADPKKAIELWNLFENDAVTRNYNIWKLFDIRNGIAEVTNETFEAFIPQMLNLELIDGVNFQKGCYPGQEIVARTHYLGKPNRRMYKASILAEENFTPGTNIYSQTDGDQAVGKVVSNVRFTRDNVDALIVLRTEKENDESLYIKTLNKSYIKVESLPYSLEIKPSNN